jgi:cell division protein FtsB
VDDQTRRQVALIIGSQAIDLAAATVREQQLRDALDRQTQRTMELEGEVADLRATLALHDDTG